MRKKGILFLLGSLDSGGVSKSMLSLLNVIDKEHYDVSLLLGNTHGAFNDQVPEGVHVISDRRITALTAGIGGIMDLLVHFNWLLLLGNLLRPVISLCFGKAWAGWWLSRLMPRVTKEYYDLAVDYNGQHQLYYMVDKIHCGKKITFFHTDYRRWSYYLAVDKLYYPKVDGIFTISEICVEALKEVFPECADKVHLMENIVSPLVINRLAAMPIAEQPDAHRLVFISIGHLNKQKGSDLALQVARELKECGVDYEWWFVGMQTDDLDYLGMVKEYGLFDRVRLLGVKSNPYPYIRRADIVVHLSRFEGKSIALDEAKLLCKPIVVTNFSTVNDQFEDHVNGSICNMDVESATNAIVELVKDKKLYNSYVDYLKNNIVDNSNEINKIYRWVE